MTLLEPDLVDETETFHVDPGDHERLTHIVMPKSAVAEAYITGTPVRALCGWAWVPTKDPERFPICPECREILNTARAAQGKDPI